MSHRAPLALYVGRDHILTAVNETWATLFVGDPPIGMPAREAFLGPGWPEFVAQLDAAWATGETTYAPCEPHHSTVVIAPLWESGQLVGLVTGCGLERLAPMPASLPRLTGRVLVPRT